MITPKENNSGKHGHWERINIFFSLMGIYRCSLCKGATEPTAFCSMCGGQMDEAEKALAKTKEEAPSKFFAPEEVRKMSPKEVKANYTAIMNSMKEWK